METKVPEKRKLLLAFGLLLLCIGCTHAVPINANLPISPVIDSLPLSVGVYYGQEFIDKKFDEVGAFLLDYSLGPPSVLLFDQIFGAIFKKTVRVNALPPLSPDATKLDAIIEPRIDEFWGVWEGSQIRREAQVTYSITVFSLSGEKFASMKVTGRGKSNRLGPVSNAEESINGSLRDAAAQIMANFCEHAEVRNWLQHAGISSPQEY